MALKITLKPGEKMMIGGAVVTNGTVRSDLIIENRVPILREKDIMKEEAAISPTRRIYFVIQLMYIDEGNVGECHSTYWKLVKDVVSAAPSTLKLIDQMSGRVLNGEYYQALKLARKLIDYEREAINSVQ
ncbi:MAG: flagellar biosynthesis repressor FlbT [Syntrophales bacterium]|nr:flagellar biosynthesis repressor FlbT [Syntrophales bacterium]